ncbi:PLP-dependent aspartate aminotransferase family protein [Fodinicurvata sp. EGI_FJ10296]|uniref:trans-sulfuration enzyme family protein n=1 Tax=Fodinicurvata sp. EGI_FJ10296 TaxID=3231908 RepID=UPI0034567FEB
MTSSRRNSDLRPATLAAQAGGGHDPQTGAVVPPMHASTTYARDADYALIGAGRVYSRPDNPTYDAVEALMTGLEGGAASLAFASGLAAISAVIQAIAGPDDSGQNGHVVIGRDLYYGTAALLETFKDAFGLTVDRVDTTDPAAVRAAMKPGRTRLVIVEPIANPTWAVTDIAAIADIAHEIGAALAVDNTVLTPILFRPLESGADLVIHSATKYLNGHSDVVAGVVTTGARNPLWQRIEAARRLSGAVLGPFEAWLLLRGMRTLSLRVREQTRAAEAIARRFDGDPRVAQVLYPTLAEGVQRDIAQRQFSQGSGGMLSLRVAPAPGRSALKTALATIGATQVFVRATSLGGVESLIEHRWTVEGGTTGVPDDLLRVSVGIEDIDDLIADLDQALAVAHARFPN